MTDDLDIPELTEEFFKRSIRASRRNRIMQGQIESGEDIAALRRFVQLTQKEFARALEISVHTLRNWEQGRRKPEGPAIALLKIAARHPRIVREAAGVKPPSAAAAKR
jgi:putative transcriptional regulator